MCNSSLITAGGDGMACGVVVLLLLLRMTMMMLMMVVAPCFL